MSEHPLGSLPSGRSSDGAELLEASDSAPPRRRATDRIAEDTGALTRFEREQLTREFAEIERASAALRLGEPALRSWVKPATPPALAKPRPLWLLIGVLWLSTAILTVGALAAIASLAG